MKCCSRKEKDGPGSTHDEQPKKFRRDWQFGTTESAQCSIIDRTPLRHRFAREAMATRIPRSDVRACVCGINPPFPADDRRTLSGCGGVTVWNCQPRPHAVCLPPLSATTASNSPFRLVYRRTGRRGGARGLGREQGLSLGERAHAFLTGAAYLGHPGSGSFSVAEKSTLASPRRAPPRRSVGG